MKTLVMLFLFGWFPAALATPLVISDIDDTIKVTHVLNWGGVGSVFGAEAFWGMPDLYRALAGAPANASFIYVSTAPKELMGGAHEEFLRLNGFPRGPLFLEPWFLDSDFKERTIRNLLEARKPSQVILLGDNGQRDAAIYDKITREFAPQGIHFIVFIRQAYSKESGAAELAPGQIPFVTAGEIALVLNEIGLLPWDQTARSVSVSFERPGPYWQNLERRYPGASLGLPEWIDCRDHRVRPPANAEVLKTVTPFLQKIFQRCQVVIED